MLWQESRKKKKYDDASVVVQQANLPPVVPVSHMGTASSPRYSTSDPAPCLWPGEQGEWAQSLGHQPQDERPGRSSQSLASDWLGCSSHSHLGKELASRKSVSVNLPFKKINKSLKKKRGTYAHRCVLSKMFGRLQMGSEYALQNLHAQHIMTPTLSVHPTGSRVVEDFPLASWNCSVPEVHACDTVGEGASNQWDHRKLFCFAACFL